MTSKYRTIQFQSALAPLIKQFIQEKRISGYKYNEAVSSLKRLDSFLCNTTIQKNELPKKIVLQWLEKQPHEQTSTQQSRVCLVRQLSQFMVKLGYSSYVPPAHIWAKRQSSFSPHIFTHEEMTKMLHAADEIKPNAWFPLRYLIMPEMFRLLYGCGFRLGELLNLRVRDVDLQQGVIIIRGGKFGKDRLVPPSTGLVERLRIYAEQIEKNTLDKITDESFFFPSRRNNIPLHNSTIYFLFRKLLHKCGIPHAGRGKGPRVHDIRHTFAVHRLIKWYEEGCDLNAKLPLLVTYLGHQDFTGTQKYLHLTAELFPNLALRMNKQFGDLIPGGSNHETN